VHYAPFPDQVFVSEFGDPATAQIIASETRETIIDVADPVVGFGIGMETRVFGSRLVTFTEGGSSEVLDTVTHEILYEAPEGTIAVAASPDGSLLLIAPVPTNGQLAGELSIVDLTSREVTTVLDTESLWLPWFSDDNRWLFDGGGQMFDMADGRLALLLPDTMSIRPMPDGETISVVDGSGTLWHASLNEMLSGATLEEAALWSAFASEGNVVPLGHIASSDGSLVATSSRAVEPVKIWDSVTGSQIASLDPRLVNGAPYIFFHPDEPHVTLQSEGGVLLTYTLDIDELIAIAKGRVSRSLTDAECQTFLHIETCPSS
jgi:WD40 repeat protein